MDKFCQTCGKARAEGAAFCDGCGTAFATEPVIEDKFCQTCGKPRAEGAAFCDGCGAAFGAAPAAVAATPIQTVYGYFKKAIPFIFAAIAILGLITAILNLFQTYDVTAVANINGTKQSGSGPIKDLFKGDEYTGLLVINIIYGVCSLAMVALSALGIVNIFVKKKDASKLFTKTALFAFASTLVYMILFAILGYESESTEFFGSVYKISTSVRVHFTAWIAVIFYGLCSAADIVLGILSKKK